MKLVRPVAAFLGGIALGIFIVGLLNDIFPWFWLPTLLGIAIGAISSGQEWLRTRRLSFWFPSSVGLAAALTFSLSTTPVTSRFGTALPYLIVLALGGCFGVSLVFFIARGWAGGKSVVFCLMVPIVAALIIGFVSGGVGGASHMVDFLVRVFHLPAAGAEDIVRVVRKTIHFSAYGLVGLGAFRGAICGHAQRWRAIVFALLTVLSIASFDEMRQTTSPNRSGSPWDVLLDVTGAAVFVGISALATRKAPAGRRSRG